MNKEIAARLAVRVTMLFALVSSAACSGGETQPPADAGTNLQDAGPGGPPAGSFPATTSAAGIQTFLSTDPYLANGWTAETSTPRPESDPVSPHEAVRVFFNPALIDSFARGNGRNDAGQPSPTPPHDRYSMVVKEFHASVDGGTMTRVGRAAILKTGDGGMPSAWTWFCVGPSARCAGMEGTESNPVYGVGDGAFQCSVCHGGTIFTLPP